MITDWNKQVERWAEHYQELYSRENIVADAAVESTPNLPVMEELDIPLSEEELGKAIDSLACGRASGKMLQEKCWEQRQPLYVAFIDLTKAFDLVSRKGLFTLPQKIECPPKLLRMITSFYEDMQGTVQHDGSFSDPFPIKSRVKQGCVLAPTLFGIFFSLLLSYAFSQLEDGVYLHTRNESLQPGPSLR
ncbi:uncharacterized protein LOC143288283 [Babylonia areolata]|uniref:uncharacterized protein LOC143288283 n=1 Tax=Babylonia areolata TaxID=304850 RepID=UPI003FD4FDF6